MRAAAVGQVSAFAHQLGKLRVELMGRGFQVLAGHRLESMQRDDDGVTVRLVFQVGEPPKATPRENLQNLLKFGSQFDNIEIK